MVKRTLVSALLVCIFDMSARDVRFESASIAYYSTVVQHLSPDAALVNHMSRRCKDWLQSGRRFGLAQVFSNQEARRAYTGKTEPITFERWSREYAARAGAPPDQAESVLIGENCLVRILRNGVVSRKVLFGSDVLHGHVGGGRYEIVHMAVRRQPQLTRKHNADNLRVQFYVRTAQSPSVSAAEAILSHLIDSTGAKNVIVVLRSDPWFIEDEDVPIRLPYLPYDSPPTSDQYRLAPETRCLSDQAGPICGK